MRIHCCTPFALVLLSAFAFCSHAFAGVIFFVEPNAYPVVNPNRDLGWQAAVGGNFVELDLDGIPNRTDVDTLQAGNITLDVGLFDAVNGVSSTAEIFHGAYQLGGGSYGTVHAGAFVNLDPRNRPYDEITFSFSTPVQGFGAWIFDDGFEAATHQLIATEVGGFSTTSAILNGNNGIDFFVEGFLGVTSDVGLTDVSLRVLNPRFGGFFEVDHLQIAELTAIPEPASMALWLFSGLVASGFARVRRRATR